MNLIASTIEQIIANPKGGTSHLVGNPLPDHGYFVGGAGTSIVFPADIGVDRFLATQFMLRASGSYVGWWTDDRTGKPWLDEVDWFEQEWFARGIALDRGELAFWNIRDSIEMRTEQ